MCALHTSALPLKPGADSRFSRKKLVLFGGLTALVIIVIAGVLLAVPWPFRESAIIKNLEEAGSGKVEIRNFRQIYFPHPGCIAEGVTYRLATNASPFVTLEKLTIQSNYLGLLGSHISRIRADGMHIYVPPKGSKQKFNGLNSASTHIDEIDVYNAVLEVPRQDAGKAPVLFGIHELTLNPASANRPMHFSTTLSNPEPPGEIIAAGEFGPWRGMQTPVKGDYTFKNADLGTFEGIAGILFSEGKFSGILQHIDVAGKINIPEFEVNRSDHKVALNSEFTAYVNGANGDTFLNQVSSEFLKTKVISKGMVAAAAGQKGKTATIDIEAQNGRIEDILRLFTREGRPPMAGEVSFQGRAILPAGEMRFLKKIQLAGDFGISDSSFTRQSTQEKVDQLSQSAKTDDIEKLKRNNKGRDKDTDNSPAPPCCQICEAMLC